MMSMRGKRPRLAIYLLSVTSAIAASACASQRIGTASSIYQAQENKRAKSLGVAVFFISARPLEMREATEKNLRVQGFVWDEVVLLPPNATFASASDFKALERKKIAGRGYTILLTMGDQQSGLSGGYAERTFKLPNPVYFLP